jgi:hypothetical protein
MDRARISLTQVLSIQPPLENSNFHILHFAPLRVGTIVRNPLGPQRTVDLREAFRAN